MRHLFAIPMQTPLETRYGRDRQPPPESEPEVRGGIDGDAGEQTLQAEALWRRGAVSLLQGRPAQTLDDCSQAIAHYLAAGAPPQPGLAEAHRLLGLALRLAGQPEEARAHLRTAVEVHTKLAHDDPLSVLALAQAHRNLGWLEAELGALPDAEELYGRAISACEGVHIPEQSQAEELLAGTFSERSLLKDHLGASKQSEQDLGRAVQLYEHLVEAQGRLDLRPELARGCHDLGLLDFDKGELESSRRQLTRGLELYLSLWNEGCSEALADLALIHYDRARVRASSVDQGAARDMHVAMGHYHELALSEPRFLSQLAALYNDRGFSLAADGRLQEAVADYEQAIVHYQSVVGHRRDLATVHFNLAGVLGRVGAHPKALDHYGRAEKILLGMEVADGTTADLARVLVNQGLARASSGEFAAAVSDYTRAIDFMVDRVELRQDLATAYNNRGCAHANMRKFSLAIADYGRATSLLTHLTEACASQELTCALMRSLQNRGRSLADCGKFREAREDVLRVIELSTKVSLPPAELAAAWSLMAAASVELGDADRGLEAYDIAIGLFEGLENLRDSRAVQAELAGSYRARGSLWRLKGQPRALDDIEKSLHLYLPLLATDQGKELACRVAATYAEKSLWLLAGCHYQAALEEAGRVLDLCSADDLEAQTLRARAHQIRGRCQHMLEDGLAQQEYTAAINLYTTLVEDTGQLQLCADLAAACCERAQLVNDPQSALCDYGWAIEILEELVEGQGRADLRAQLGTARMSRAGLISALDQGPALEQDLRRGIALLGQVLSEDRTEPMAGELASACLRMAGLCRLKGDLSGAQDYCNQASDLLSRFEQPPDQLPAVLQESAALAEALGDLPKAVDSWHQVAATLNGLRDSGRTELEKDLVEAHHRRAELLARLGQLDVAIEEYGAAIHIYLVLQVQADTLSVRQGLGSAYGQRGRLFFRLGNLERSLQDLSLAVKLLPGSPDSNPAASQAYHDRGLLYHQSEEVDLAVADFTRAVDIMLEVKGQEGISRDLALTYNARGSARMSMSDFAEAAQDFDKALELYADLADATHSEYLCNLALIFNNRGQNLIRLGQPEPALASLSEAVVHYLALVEKHQLLIYRDRLAEAHVERGCALGNLGRATEAIDDLATAIRLYRTLVGGEGQLQHREAKARAHFQRALLLNGLGRSDEAANDYEAAASLYSALVDIDSRHDLVNPLLRCREALKASLT